MPRESDEFAFGQSLMGYEHISMLHAVQQDPWRALEAIDESAADPAISDVDRQIENLCRIYSSGSDRQRVDLRRMASNGWSLLHFAHRMAIRSMRTHDADWIRLGLISLSLENGRSDSRETLSCLAMLCHAASSVKADFAVLAEEATPMSSPGMRACLREFVARDRKSQSLAAFGLRETHDANGPRIDAHFA